MCAGLLAPERDYLATLVAGVDDEQLGPAYGHSAGLCLPHLQLALAAFPDRPGVETLVSGALERLDRLAADLGRFIASHDHRSVTRCSEHEARAWTEAVAFVAGAPDVFGSEVRRPAGSWRTAPGADA